jgi:hypothetical protein
MHKLPYIHGTKNKSKELHSKSYKVINLHYIYLVNLTIFCILSDSYVPERVGLWIVHIVAQIKYSIV